MLHEMFRGSQLHRYGPLRVRIAPLHFEATDKFRGRRVVYRLTEPYGVSMLSPCGEFTMIIPEGYETDLATIPLICQPFIGSSAEFQRAAVVHDMACDNGWPQFAANALMRVVMEARKHPRWKVLGIYYTLMLFGYGSWVARLFTRKKLASEHETCDNDT